MQQLLENLLTLYFVHTDKPNLSYMNKVHCSKGLTYFAKQNC